MCTMTIIPRTEQLTGLRIVFSRDEKRSRPTAELPQEHRMGGRRVVMPRDPATGGTWIAVNDAGIVLALLNVNEEKPARRAANTHRPRRSRGLIIPALAHMDSVDAIVQRCLQLGAPDFAPFRLIVASLGGCIELASFGGVIRCRSAVLPGRVAMFTSSGLGDQLVEAPRRNLFEIMLGDGRHAAGAQDAFHQHHWPDRPHLSVWMARPDARTLSRTTIEVRETRISMRYDSLDEAGRETATTTHELPIEDTSRACTAEQAAGAQA